MTKHYLANPDVSCVEEVDGALLFNPDVDRTVVLNLTGLRLWQMLQTPQTEDEMVLHLLETTRGATPEQVSEDVAKFLSSLGPDYLQEINDGD
jgi:hypothetical protein